MNISVLISVYYKEKPEFTRLAIDSVLNQTLPPEQIVLVKDGPLTPGLDELIEAYRAAHAGLFTIVVLSENKGLGLALQTGLLHCRNEIVARMDTDDICLPERFRRQAAFLESNPDIAIVGANIEEFNQVPGDLHSYRILPETMADIVKVAKYRNPLNHPTIMFRKAAVLDSGSYNGDILFWEDYALFIRMLKRGYRFYNIQEILLYFRVGSGIETIKRRSGMHYVKSELKFARYARSIGHLSTMQWLMYVALKVPVRLLPPRLVLFLYQKLFRKAARQ